jgi:spore coat protein U-like protein
VLREMTALVPLVLCPAVVGAGMTRATLQVSAQVVNNCVANVPSSVILPRYTGTQVRSRGHLEMRCTKGASPVISLGGSVLSADIGARVLTGPDGGRLTYQVYSDPDYSSVWNAMTEPPADGLTLKSYALYWEIPSGQAASSGTYSANLDVGIDPGTHAPKHFIIRVSSHVP